METAKIQKFPNSRWRMNAILKIFFCGITLLHIVRLRWNLEWGCTIARIRRFCDENVFEDSTWRTAAILKIVISLYLNRESSEFDEIWYADTNFTQVTEMWQKFRNSQIQNGGRTPHITQLHIVSLRWNLEWGLRRQNLSTRIRRSMIKMHYENSIWRRRHFGNRISTSEPRIFQTWRNLVRKGKFWQLRKQDKYKSEINV